jgi:uncharacterized membrane protein YfcA
MTTGVLILISAIGLLSSFVSGIFGMAGGQIMLASLLLFLPVASSLVVFAAVQVVSVPMRLRNIVVAPAVLVSLH